MKRLVTVDFLLWVFLAASIGLLILAINARAQVLVAVIGAGTFTGGVEARYAVMNAIPEVQFVCSDPVADLNDNPISDVYDFPSSPTGSGCMDATSGKQLFGLGSGSVATVETVSGWGTVPYAMQFGSAARFKSTDLRSTSAFGVDANTQAVAFRYYMQVDADYGQAGNNSFTTGRCNYIADGLTLGSWEFVSTTEVRYPADITAEWKSSGPTRAIGIQGPSGNTQSRISSSVFSAGWTNIQFDQDTVANETWTFVGRGCSSACPRNKLMEFNWTGATVNQMEERANSSCGQTAAPGDYDSNITDYTDISGDTSWSSTQFLSPRVSFNDCKTGPCRIEACIEGDLLNGIGLVIYHRVYSIDTGVLSTATSTASGDLGGGPKLSQNGMDGFHSSGDGTYGMSGNPNVGFWMQVNSTDTCANSWPGAAVEIEG